MALFARVSNRQTNGGAVYSNVGTAASSPSFCTNGKVSAVTMVHRLLALCADRTLLHHLLT